MRPSIWAVVVSLSMALLVGGVAVSSPLPPDGVSPLEGSDRADERPSALPPEGTAPLEEPAQRSPDQTTSSLPIDGLEPLDGASSSPAEPAASELPSEGATPLGYLPAATPKPLDPTAIRMARMDVMLGPVGRIRPVDTVVTVGAALGRMQGFSGTIHTSMIVVSDRGVVQAFDFPIGVGALFRGRLRSRPMYGSVGLTAGILVHRARTTLGVVHRVDPDLRLPIRFDWTITRAAGLSLALVPGYSVRERSYQRRGAAVWNRHSVRLGLLIGLHWDIVEGRAKRRRSGGDGDGER